jgi:hypothetical protein
MASPARSARQTRRPRRPCEASPRRPFLAALGLHLVAWHGGVHGGNPPARFDSSHCLFQRVPVLPAPRASSTTVPISLRTTQTGPDRQRSSKTPSPRRHASSARPSVTHSTQATSEPGSSSPWSSSPLPTADLAPNSSATTFTTERALPSSAVQLRCCSRVVVLGRLPFDRDSAACSAWSRQRITVKNDGSCSLRFDTATRNTARANAALGVP